MTTDLQKPVKRKLKYGSRDYILTFNALGVNIREKGTRGNGVFVDWEDIIKKGFGFDLKSKGIKTTSSGRTLVDRGKI